MYYVWRDHLIMVVKRCNSQRFFQKSITKKLTVLEMSEKCFCCELTAVITYQKNNMIIDFKWSLHAEDHDPVFWLNSHA